MSSAEQGHEATSAVRSRWLSVGLGAAMAALFVGERLIAAGPGRAALAVIAAGAILAVLSVRARRVVRSAKERAPVERALAGLTLLAAIAVGLYVLQSDWVDPPEPGAPPVPSYVQLSLLSLAWPVLWLVSAVGLALGEAAYAPMEQARRPDVGRVRMAVASGVAGTCALVFALCVAYAAAERDVWIDLGSRALRPSDATLKLVSTLRTPVEVELYFPPVSETGEELREYFEKLRARGERLSVVRLDHALEPERARRAGVTRNGSVVLLGGQRYERTHVGIGGASARDALARLDAEVQRMLLLITRERRMVYFVTGHGERTFEEVSDGLLGRPGIRRLHGLLTQAGHAISFLGAASGLASEVPSDAGLVVMIGPTQPLSLGEGAALRRYLEAGGRLLLALDPEPGLAYHEVLEVLGLRFVPTRLANDRVYRRRAHQKTDRAELLVQTFGSHPSVSTIARLSGGAPVVLSGAGYLEPLAPMSPGTTVELSIVTSGDTFNDLNGNLDLDAPDERRDGFAVAAAVERVTGDGPPARAVVLGDSDALADDGLPLGGNVLVAHDVLRWLTGEDEIIGAVSAIEDAPIVHSRDQDVAWFYSGVFGAPLAVLLLGASLTWRRRRPGPAPARGSAA